MVMGESRLNRQGSWLQLYVLKIKQDQTTQIVYHLQESSLEIELGKANGMKIGWKIKI